MDEFKFADRYAQAGLAPSGPLIVAREEPARRIVSTIIDSNILDLVAAYYGSTDVDLAWFRDEFAKEDPSFSLVNNEREARVLAAPFLGAEARSCVSDSENATRDFWEAQTVR